MGEMKYFFFSLCLANSSVAHDSCTINTGRGNCIKLWCRWVRRRSEVGSGGPVDVERIRMWALALVLGDKSLRPGRLVQIWEHRDESGTRSKHFKQGTQKDRMEHLLQIFCGQQVSLGWWFNITENEEGTGSLRVATCYPNSHLNPLPSRGDLTGRSWENSLGHKVRRPYGELRRVVKR